ncbi:MAG: ABC transporter ATP-binding protein [Clostridiales bacterium]|nr:ABC transporter ATP-binding protein [Candidatus Apopatousia equi]
MISTEIDYEQLQQEKYVSLDMYKMGVALRNDTLQIWVNTDAKIDIQKVVNICVILISIYLCSYIFSLVEGLLMATTTQKISKNLRTDINKKINKLPLSYIDATSYGNLMSRTTNDVDAISMGLNNSITTLIGAITLLIACLIMMFITNYIMALTAIASCLIGFILIAVIMSKSQKYFKAQQKNLGEVNGHIEETFTAHDIISVYNSTNLRKHEFTKFNNELYKSTYKSQFLSGLMPSLMMFIGNFGYVAICVVGAVLVSQGSITIGTIVAFMLYVRLFSNPLTQIAQAMTNLQSTAAASERVFELLDEDEISESVDKKKTDIKKIQGNVSFENVKFGYTKDKLIIKDFSAEIKKGQKVAIVGPTGAGKTTIVNLLMLFYDINSGSIKIDGKDIKDMKRRDLHNTFGMVLQDTWLFEGTVRENLIYNKQSVSNKKLDEICEVCGLTHFIKTLPNGYDTVLDDNTNISAGQKQLLTIARAMVQNAPMLILDEATSSIDTRTETLIQKAIDNLTKDRTSFVIAHRLSTIKNADIILVMKDGDIIEQGNHKELLRQNGFYAELYNSQFAEN